MSSEHSPPHSPPDLQGGNLGMANGEHRDDVDLGGEKFYVVGRGRYRNWQLDAPEGPEGPQVDMRNVLPLEAPLAFTALRDALQQQNAWQPARAALVQAGIDAEALPADAEATNENALEAFCKAVWGPTVRGALEAHSGFVPDEHKPQLLSGGRVCFDVKICKLLPRKARDRDADINGDITRTRAIEVLRMLRTRIASWPVELSRVLFRGQAAEDGTYPGIQNGFELPENDADEPFSRLPNDAFRYAPEYEGQPDPATGVPPGPVVQVIENDWGLRVNIIKPAAEEELEGGEKDMYTVVRGQDAHNRFGTRSELRRLEWLTDGKAFVGLQQLDDGSSMIEAWKWASSMPQLLQPLLAKGRVFVWVPPEHAGRADGYYAAATAQVPHWAAIELWALDFYATPASRLAQPETPRQMRTARLLNRERADIPAGWDDRAGTVFLIE